MDITQIIIIVSLILITLVIVVSGIFLIKIFKQLQTTINKTNNILDDAHLITSSVAKPVSSVSEFVMGFKNGFSFFNKLFDKKDKKEIKNEE
jgi:hypothetical protein